MALPDLSGTPRHRTGTIDLVGRVLAGRYRLVAPVGIGASAQVYVADDVQLRRRVAVKILHPGLAGDPTFLKRFQAEAQAAAALNHPNVVAVYDWGRDESPRGGDAVPFLVTEYLHGGNLRAILDSGNGDRASQALSLSQTLLVGLEVCRGLHYAHNRGFVHHDIKPANLLFGDDHRLRIADFGLARALAEASWTEPEGVVLGTARYVSPEQAAGMPVDTRSDLYSLALVLVECVTGVVPHTADTALGTLRARLGRDVLVDADVFGPLAPLIEAAGKADPAERFTAARLGAALMATAETLPAPTPIPLVPPQVFEPPDDADDVTMHFGPEPPPVVIPDGPPVVVPDASTTPAPSNGQGHGPPPGTAAFNAVTAPFASITPTPAGWTAPGAPSVAASGSADGATAGSVTGPAQHEHATTTVNPALAPAATPAAGDAGPGEAGLAAVRKARRQRRRPRARTVAVFLLVVSALAVLGALAYGIFGDRMLGPTRYTVENYVSEDLATVQQQLNEAGHDWDVRVSTTRRDGSDANEILSQDPVAGTKLASGERLQLVASLGEELVTVPTGLVGKVLDDPPVLATFTERSLIITRTPTFDESAPVGQILQVAEAGTDVERGSSVVVTVSQGPQPRTLADYVTAGTSIEAVQAELQTLGLKSEVATEPSETVAEKGIISMVPPAGTEVAKGSTVQLVASSGLPVLTVPAVVGLTGLQANDRLTSGGWSVGNIIGPPSGTVIGTDPEQGAQRRKYSKIDIITRSN